MHLSGFQFFSLNIQVLNEPASAFALLWFSTYLSPVNNPGWGVMVKEKNFVWVKNFDRIKFLPHFLFC